MFKLAYKGYEEMTSSKSYSNVYGIPCFQPGMGTDYLEGAVPWDGQLFTD